MCLFASPLCLNDQVSFCLTKCLFLCKWSNSAPCGSLVYLHHPGGFECCNFALSSFEEELHYVLVSGIMFQINIDIDLDVHIDRMILVGHLKLGFRV